MNADAFRHVYNYHFAENRNLWDTHVMPLSDEAFNAEISYSIGSVRNQIVHLMSADDTWFSGLRGIGIPEPLNPDAFADRTAIRAYWDTIEGGMRGYLANLRDDMLFTKPMDDGDPDNEDKDLVLWQVLLHVINHGTDHRAQLLRILHDLGAKTISQDYIFYVYENP